MISKRTDGMELRDIMIGAIPPSQRFQPMVSAVGSSGVAKCKFFPDHGLIMHPCYWKQRASLDGTNASGFVDL